MAAAFNLTAQLNLRGPNNVRTIVADIRRQLGTITGDVNLRIDPAATQNVTRLNSALTTLNNNLRVTQTNATNAANAMRQFTASIASIGNTTNNLNRNLNNAATAAQRVGQQAQGTGRQVAVAATAMEEFGRQSQLAVRRFVAFSAGTAAVVGLVTAVRKGVDAFIEFDKQFVKLQQVTGESSAGLSKLAGTISSLSTGLGVSSSELTEVSSTLAQAGLSARDTERALKALALSSLAPSFDDMNQTVEGSIALMRQFGISAIDLEKSLGAVNAVAAKFAVESSDIIAAIQRTGGVFASASKGVSEGTDALNEFIAVFTSVRATTRESAETIATGLRTIFTRIQRGGTIEALKEFGVNLTDVEGKFVGAFKAVQLLSEGLNTIDPRDLKFSQIVEELGGFRQIGKVIPLIQQFATAQEALKVAQAGQSSLAEDAALAQLSLANQAAKVREEFLALFREIGGSDTFQTMAKGALSLASALISVADSVKGVLPVLAIMTAFRGASALRQFGTGFAGGFRSSGGMQGLGNRLGGGRQTNAKGGFIKRYRSGGDVEQVPVALMPGEAVIFPEDAAKIGSSTLKRMNHADKRQKRAKGGKIGMVPGQGNSDSFYTTLPAGSFVIRKAATEAMGPNFIGDVAKGRQKFITGGPISNLGGSLIRSSVRETSFTYDKDIGEKFRTSGSKPTKFNTRDKYNYNRINRKINVDTMYSDAEKKTNPVYKEYKGLSIRAKYGSSKQIRGNSASNRGYAFEKVLQDRIKNLSLENKASDAFSRLDGTIGSNVFEAKSEQDQLSDQRLSEKIVSAALSNRAKSEKIMSNRLASNKLDSKTNTIDLGSVILFQDITSGLGKEAETKTETERKTKERPNNRRSAPAQKRAFGGYIQKLMAGQFVKSRAGRKKELRLADITKADAERLPSSTIISELSAPTIQAMLKESGVPLSANDLMRKKNLSVQEAAVRDKVIGAYVTKVNSAAQENRGREASDTKSAVSKGLLFGAVGMFGRPFPPENIQITKGLKQPTDIRVFGAVLDRNKAAREARLQKREEKLQKINTKRVAKGKSELKDIYDLDIIGAPIASDKSRQYTREEISGIKKRRNQSIINEAEAALTKGLTGFFDFDDTSVVGRTAFPAGYKEERPIKNQPAKSPDYTLFGNMNAVGEGLEKAKPTPLMKRLARMLRKAKKTDTNLYSSLLSRINILSARPDDTMKQVVGPWLKSQGLDLPGANVMGVGTSGLSAKGVAAAKTSSMLQKSGASNSFIVDDSTTNTSDARAAGIRAYTYSPKVDLDRATRKSLADMEGAKFENDLKTVLQEKTPLLYQAMLQEAETHRSIDFPYGLGPNIARGWFNNSLLASIPVDAKRTLKGPRGVILKNITNYLKAKNYAMGGEILSSKDKRLDAKKLASFLGQKSVTTDQQKKLAESLKDTTVSAPSKVNYEELLKGYARGGEVPIVAQAGEYVINRKSARSIGYNNLARLNKYHNGGKVQKFAKGGSVDSIGATSMGMNSKLFTVLETTVFRVVDRFSKLANTAAGTGVSLGNISTSSSKLGPALANGIIENNEANKRSAIAQNAVARRYASMLRDMQSRGVSQRDMDIAMSRYIIKLNEDSQAKRSARAPKQKTFKYEAIDGSTGREIRDTVMATSMDEARKKVADMGQNIIRIKGPARTLTSTLEDVRARLGGVADGARSLAGSLTSGSSSVSSMIKGGISRLMGSSGTLPVYGPPSRADLALGGRGRDASAQKAALVDRDAVAARTSLQRMRSVTSVSSAMGGLTPADKKQALIDAGFGKGGAQTTAILNGRRANSTSLSGGGMPPGGMSGPATPDNNDNSRSGRLSNMAMGMSFAIPMIADMFTSGEAKSESAARSNVMTQGIATSAGSGLMLGSMASEVLGGGKMGMIGGALTGLVAAGIGVAKAFADAENAAREFAITSATDKLEMNIEKASKSFDAFQKDLKNINLRNTVQRDVIGATSSADDIQSARGRTQRGLVNFTDTGEGSSERSQILFEKGIGDYLASTSLFGGGKQMRSNIFSTMIPKKANEAAKDYAGASQLSSQFLQQRVRSGESVTGMMGSADFTKLTRSLSLADSAIQEQIMTVQNLVGVENEDKQARINNILAIDGESKARKLEADIIKQMKLEEFDRSTNQLQNSMERMFQNMEQAIGKNVFELDKLSQQADLSAAALSGQAKAGNVRLKSINVLQNPRAYSSNERNAEISKAGNMFGAESSTVSGLLQASGRLEDTIMSTINQTIKEDPKAGNEKIGIRITSSISKVLEGLKLPPDVSAKLGESVNSAIGKIRTKGDEKIDFGDLMEKIPQLGKVMDITRRAQEAAVKALEHWQGALNDYGNSMNQIVDLQVEANARLRRASDIGARGQMELDKALGKEISLRTQMSVALAGVKSQTGGATNPVDISQNIRNLENRRSSLESMSNTAGQRGFSGKDEFVLMQNRLRSTNIALRENYDALKSMADNTEMASIAMSKINEIQQKRQAGVNIAETLVTSSPEELSSLNRAMDRLNNNMAGNLNTSSTSDERKESLDAFNMIAPFLGEQQNAMKANVLESMLLESGVGTNGMMGEVIQSLRNPEGDPQMQAAIEEYKKAVDLQVSANRELADLNLLMKNNTAEIAAQKLTAAMRDVQFDFKSTQLSDINNSIKNLIGVVEGKPAAMAPGKAMGGLIYAAAGQLVDFQPKGTDTVPAMLTPGEFVVNRAATQRNLPLLNKINSGGYSAGGKVRYYADGGFITTNSKWSYNDEEETRKDIAQDKFNTSNTSVFESKEKYPIFKNKNLIDRSIQEMYGIRGTFYATSPQSDTLASANIVGNDVKFDGGTSLAYEPKFGIGYSSIYLDRTRGKVSPVFDGSNKLQIESVGMLPNKEAFSSIYNPEDSSSLQHIPKNEQAEYISLYSDTLKKLGDIKKNNTKIASNGIETNLSLPSIVDGIKPQINVGTDKVSIDNLASKNGLLYYLLNLSDIFELKDNRSNLGNPFGFDTNYYDGKSYDSSGARLDVVSGLDKFQEFNSLGFTGYKYGNAIRNSIRNFQDNTSIKGIASAGPTVDFAIALRTNLAKALDDLKKDKFDKETYYSTGIKNTIGKFTNLWNETVFSDTFDRGYTGFDLDKAGVKSPVTLYNEKVSEQWSTYVGQIAELAKDKEDLKYAKNETDFIGMKNLADPANIKNFAWTGPFGENEKDLQNIFRGIEKSSKFVQQNVIAYPKNYDTDGVKFSYLEYDLKSRLYNTVARRYSDTLEELGFSQGLGVIRSQAEDQKGVNPFSGLLQDNENIYFSKIDEIIKSLEIASKNKYMTTLNTASFAAGAGLDETALSTMDGSTIETNGKSFNFSEFFTSREQLKKDKAKQAATNQAKKNMSDTEIIKLTDAKRVTVARKVADYVSKGNTDLVSPVVQKVLAGRKIESLNDIKDTALAIGSAVPGNTNTKSLAFHKVDAWRALFSEIYQGGGSKNADVLQQLGANMAADQFIDFPDPPPPNAVEEYLGNKIPKYYADYSGFTPNLIQSIIDREIAIKTGAQTSTEYKTQEGVDDTKQTTFAFGSKGLGKAEETLPDSWDSLLNLALDPQRIFPDASVRAGYLAKLQAFFKEGKAANGVDPIIPDTRIKNLKITNLDLIKEYFEEFDTLLNTSLDMDETSFVAPAWEPGKLRDYESFNRSLQAITIAPGPANWEDFRKKADEPLKLENPNRFGTLSAEKVATIIMASANLAKDEEANKQDQAEVENSLPFSTGGVVYASTGKLINYKPRGTDTVPAMLTPGEFVVNRAATQKNLPLLKSINDGTAGYSSGGIVYLAGGGASPGNDSSRFGPDGRLLSAEERAEIRMRESREREAAAVAQIDEQSDAKIQDSIERSRAANTERIQDNKTRAEEEKPRKEAMRAKARAANMDDSTFEYVYRENQKYGTNPMGAGYATAIPKIPLSPEEQNSKFDTELAKVKAEAAAFRQRKDELTGTAGYGLAATEVMDSYKREQADIDKTYGYDQAFANRFNEKLKRKTERGGTSPAYRYAVTNSYTRRKKLEKQLYEEFRGSSPEVKDVIDSALNRVFAFAAKTQRLNNTELERQVREEITKRMRDRRTAAASKRGIMTPNATEGSFPIRGKIPFTGIEINTRIPIGGADNPGDIPMGRGAEGVGNILGSAFNNVFRPAYAARQRRDYRRSRASSSRVQAKSSGGIVYADNGVLVPYSPKGTDTIPAMLTPGEFVINRESTSKYLPVLRAINSGSYSRGDLVKHFNSGGIVSPRYYADPPNSPISGSVRQDPFDFSKYMGDLANKVSSAISTAFEQIQINSNNQPLQQQSSNGVSSDSGSISSINEFTNRLKSIADTLAGLGSIPKEITITATHTHNIIINGDSALNQLSPKLQEIAMNMIRQKFDELAQKNQIPGAPLVNPFNDPGAMTA
jgi:ABC-type transporter Mla subunit MlaD